MADNSDINKARQSVRRSVRRLEKSGAPVELIETLNRSIQESYILKAPNGMSNADVARETIMEAKSLVNTFRVAGDTPFTSHARFNAEWRRGARGATSVYSQDDIKLFYQATVDLWEGKADPKMWGSKDSYIIEGINKFIDSQNKLGDLEVPRVHNIREAFEFFTSMDVFKEKMEELRERMKDTTEYSPYEELRAFFAGYFR